MEWKTAMRCEWIDIKPDPSSPGVCQTYLKQCGGSGRFLAAPNNTGDQRGLGVRELVFSVKKENLLESELLAQAFDVQTACMLET